MTCIIGIETQQGAVLMGDRATTISNGLVLGLARPKVMELNGLAFGGAGGITASRALRDLADQSPLTIGDVPELLRAELVAREALERDHEGKASMDSVFVLMRHGFICVLANDFTISRYDDGFIAVGSGSLVAMGALAAMPRSKTIADAVRRGTRAMKIAAQYTEGVRPPFDIIIQRHDGLG